MVHRERDIQREWPCSLSPSFLHLRLIIIHTYENEESSIQASYQITCSLFADADNLAVGTQKACSGDDYSMYELEEYTHTHTHKKSTHVKQS